MKKTFFAFAALAASVAFGIDANTVHDDIPGNVTIGEIVAAGGGGGGGGSGGVSTNEVNALIEAAVRGTNTLAHLADVPDGAARPLPKYLHALDFADSYADDAAEYYRSRGNGKVDGGCSATYKDGVLSRNFDFPFDERAEFVVRMAAGPGRFASVGVAQVGTNLTEQFVTSGRPSRWYKALPGATVDGINEHGVAAEINVVDTPVTGWRTNATDEAIHPLAAVRWVLDHATNAQSAAAHVAANIRFPAGWTQNFHYMIADAEKTYIVENGEAVSGDEYHEPDEPVTMTNFQLSKFPWEGMGMERFGLLLGGANITNAWYTHAYSPTANWASEFMSVEEQDAATNGWARLGTMEARRATGLFWQTVHTSVYDIPARTLHVAVQEQNDWYAFTVPATGGGGGGVDEGAVREIIHDYEQPWMFFDNEDFPHANVQTWHVWVDGDERNPAKMNWNRDAANVGKWSGTAYLSGAAIPLEMTATWETTNWVFRMLGHLPPAMGGDLALPPFVGRYVEFNLPAPLGITLHVSAYEFSPHATVAEVRNAIDVAIANAPGGGGTDLNAVTNVVRDLLAPATNDTLLAAKGYADATTNAVRRTMDLATYKAAKSAFDVYTNGVFVCTATRVNDDRHTFYSAGSHVLYYGELYSTVGWYMTGAWLPDASIPGDHDAYVIEGDVHGTTYKFVRKDAAPEPDGGMIATTNFVADFTADYASASNPAFSNAVAGVFDTIDKPTPGFVSDGTNRIDASGWARFAGGTGGAPGPYSLDFTIGWRGFNKVADMVWQGSNRWTGLYMEATEMTIAWADGVWTWEVPSEGVLLTTNGPADAIRLEFDMDGDLTTFVLPSRAPSANGMVWYEGVAVESLLQRSATTWELSGYSEDPQYVSFDANAGVWHLLNGDVPGTADDTEIVDGDFRYVLPPRSAFKVGQVALMSDVTNVVHDIGGGGGMTTNEVEGIIDGFQKMIVEDVYRTANVGIYEFEIQSSLTPPGNPAHAKWCYSPDYPNEFAGRVYVGPLNFWATLMPTRAGGLCYFTPTMHLPPEMGGDTTLETFEGFHHVYDLTDAGFGIVTITAVTNSPLVSVDTATAMDAQLRSDLRIAIAEAAPGDYAAVSNAAMTAVQTATYYSKTEPVLQLLSGIPIPSVGSGVLVSSGTKYTNPMTFQVTKCDPRVVFEDGDKIVPERLFSEFKVNFLNAFGAKKVTFNTYKDLGSREPPERLSELVFPDKGTIATGEDLHFEITNLEARLTTFTPQDSGKNMLAVTPTGEGGKTETNRLAYVSYVDAATNGIVCAIDRIKSSSTDPMGTTIVKGEVTAEGHFYGLVDRVPGDTRAIYAGADLIGYVTFTNPPSDPCTAVLTVVENAHGIEQGMSPFTVSSESPVVTCLGITIAVSMPEYPQSWGLSHGGDQLGWTGEPTIVREPFAARKSTGLAFTADLVDLQPKLTAGAGIAIENGVISATGGGGPEISVADQPIPYNEGGVAFAYSATGTLAFTGDWPKGKPIYLSGTLASGASIAADVRILGYDSIPVDTPVQCVAWKSGATWFVNVISGL